MRGLVALCVLVCACSRAHDPGATEVMGDDCVTCHLPDRPSGHVGTKPDTCGDCHNTTDWGQVSHPEAAFPIMSGAHSHIDCSECHDQSISTTNSVDNTNCTQCHRRTEADNDHRGEGGYMWSDTMPHFCLSCHPRGRS